MTDETGAEVEVRETFDSFIAAFNARDSAGFRAALSLRPDSLHIGTDPGEWMTTAEFPDIEADAGVTVEVDDLHVSAEGDNVAWLAGHARFVTTGGQEQAIRFSHVLVRDGDRWKIVHSHDSIGVPNEDMFG